MLVSLVDVGGNMRDLNVLRGIVSGISFDGIVNDREVARLREWTDRNRNLVYDRTQNELIDTLDSVLEDNLIEPREREEILDMVNAINSHSDVRYGKLQELYGIIDGIVCDGIINEQEIKHLNSWLSTNRAFIDEYDADGQLVGLINQLIAVDNGIVDKHNETLQELLRRINHVAFDNKLKNLCSRVKERKNIGVDLIDVLDNPDAIQTVHSKAESVLMGCIKSYSGFARGTELLVVSLSIIAMMKYDGSFYDYVREVYSDAYNQYSEQKVEGTIRSVLSEYKRGTDDYSESRKISVPLEHAVVPMYYLSAFFEFIFDVYKCNFDCSLPDDLYENFKFVFEGLKNDLKSDDDELHVRFMHKPKTYKLIVTTKRLVDVSDGLDALIKLSIIVVKLIDKYYWNRDIRIFNPYLKKGYEEWIETLEDSDVDSHGSRKSSSELRSRWQPRFYLNRNDGYIYLSPPIHKIKSQYDYRRLNVVVGNGNSEPYKSNDFSIREIFGGYQLDSEPIRIDNPLGSLEYKVCEDDTVIPGSKKEMHRKFLVFDPDGKEIDNNTDYSGDVYICSPSLIEGANKVAETEKYYLFHRHVELGEVICIGKEVFNFSCISKPGVFGDEFSNCFILDELGKIQVFKNVQLLSFEAEKSSSNIEIEINGVRSKLSDFQYTETARESHVKYKVELDICDPGIYKIAVNQYSNGNKNNIFKERFACDPEMEYDISYSDKESMDILVASDLSSDIISVHSLISDLRLDSLTFTYQGQQCIYYIPLDLGFLKIDNGKWIQPTEDLWIGDISIDSELTLLDSCCDGLIVLSADGYTLVENVAVKDNVNYKRVQIGFLHSYKADNQYVTLVFTANGAMRYMVRCYNRCVIDPDRTKIYYDEDSDSVKVFPVYKGKNPVCLEVYRGSDRDKPVVGPVEITSGKRVGITGLKSFVQYEFVFREKSKKLLLKNKTVIRTIKKTFYSSRCFAGRVFQVKSVFFNVYARGRFIQKQSSVNAFIKVRSMVDDFYVGELFVRCKNGPKPLNKINPIRMERCGAVNDHYLDVYITNDKSGDGLLFNVEEHIILNTLDSKTAPDIFYYTLDLKG